MKKRIVKLVATVLALVALMSFVTGCDYTSSYSYATEPTSATKQTEAVTTHAVTTAEETVAPFNKGSGKWNAVKNRDGSYTMKLDSTEASLYREKTTGLQNGFVPKGEGYVYYKSVNFTCSITWRDTDCSIVLNIDDLSLLSNYVLSAELFCTNGNQQTITFGYTGTQSGSVLCASLEKSIAESFLKYMSLGGAGIVLYSKGENYKLSIKIPADNFSSAKEYIDGLK